MKTARIYALIDPDTGGVRYIGRTLQTLKQREGQHYTNGLRHPLGCAREQWLHRLRLVGKRPVMRLLEEVPQEDMHNAECRWIAFYRAHGAALLNTQKGGGGGTWSYIVAWTPERDARLGKETDSAIASDLGVTRKAVAYRRILLGIPASFDRGRMKPPPPMGGWNKQEMPVDVVSKLGTVPDHVLAAASGFTKERVQRERRRLGIVSFAERTGTTGQFSAGHYPERWVKRNGGVRPDALLSGDTT